MMINSVLKRVIVIHQNRVEIGFRIMERKEGSRVKSIAMGWRNGKKI